MNHPAPNGRNRLSQDEIIGRLLDGAKQQGFEQAEVYLLEKRSLSISAKKGRVDQLQRHDELAASLRLIRDEKLGFAYTAVFTPDAIVRTADEACAGVLFSDARPGLALPRPPAGPYPNVGGPDPRINEIPLEEKITRTIEMEAAALAADARVDRVRRAAYGEAEYTVRLVNSLGLNIQYSGTAFSCGISVKAQDGDQAEMDYDSDSSHRYSDLDLAAIGHKGAIRAVSALGGIKVPGRKGPILLENRVTAQFLDILSHSFMADSVDKGKSRLAGKMDQKIFNQNLTLIDDGLYPDGMGTSPCDGEGVPSQKTVLVDQGRLAGFLYNTLQARKNGVQSTGNASRPGGAKQPPEINTSNLILLPGDQSFETLVRDMGEGLLITSIMGLHTANSISGDFSFGVAGRWVKNGALSHPVKGMALAGNLFDMFSGDLQVGSDLERFYSNITPSLFIGELTLSGL